MVDVRQMMARQAEWQKARRLLSWPEKLRQAEELRDTLRGFEALRTREGVRRNARRTTPAARGFSTP